MLLAKLSVYAFVILLTLLPLTGAATQEKTETVKPVRMGSGTFLGG